MAVAGQFFTGSKFSISLRTPFLSNFIILRSNSNSVPAKLFCEVATPYGFVPPSFPPNDYCHGINYNCSHNDQLNACEL